MNLNYITKQRIKSYFKNEEGEPFELSDGQVEIFNAIYFKKSNRVQIIAPTQYGKSSVIAMAIILRMHVYGDPFAIVTGTMEKSQIIMNKIIEFLFHDKRLYSQLDLTGEPLDKLKRERSKTRLTFKNGAEVRAYSGDARNRQRVLDSLMGFGCPNIVEDESALIQNDLQAMVLRMLGGYKNGFLCKIGNPSFRNHFYKTWNSEKYFKIFIDYKQALKEGRYTEDFIEEMKEEPYFSILYECKFPEEDEIDRLGYRRLFLNINKGEVEHKGRLRMGFDVGEGRDDNVAILRSDSYAEVVHTSKLTDLMATVAVIKKLIEKYKLDPNNVFVDRIGVGAGVYHRLIELELNVTGIKWSEKSEDERYYNLKAENFMRAGNWKGNLSNQDGWNELEVIRFKEDVNGKYRIKTKEELRNEGIKSPNVADSFALTFNKTLEELAPNIIVI